MPRQNTIEWILKTTDDASSGLRRVSGEMDNLEESSDSAQGGLSGLDDVVGQLRTVFAAFIANELIQAGIEMVELGAQAQRTEVAFRNISGGTLEAQENLEALRRATLGTVSDLELMSQGSRLMQMGLANNASEMERLVTVSTRLGSAMGLDATTAVENFSLMLANQSLPRLDSYGISSGRVRTRIEELMAATEGLTREEAFLTATLAEADIAMARLGDTTEAVTATNLERARASIENLKNSFAESAAEIAGPVVNAFSDLISASTDTLHEFDRLEAVFGKDVVDALRLAREGFGATSYSLESLSWLASQLRLEPVVYDIYEMVDASEAQVNTIDALDATLALYEDTALGSVSATDSLGGAIRGMGRQAEWGSGEVDKLARSASDMGNAFLQGIPSAEDIFKSLMATARAAGMTAEEIGALAQSMGVADNAEIQATLTMFDLVDGFAAGRVSIDAATASAAQFEQAAQLMSEAEEAASEGNDILAESLRQEAEAALIAAQSTVDLGRTTDEMTRATREGGTGIQTMTDRINDLITAAPEGSTAIALLDDATQRLEMAELAAAEGASSEAAELRSQAEAAIGAAEAVLSVTSAADSAGEASSINAPLIASMRGELDTATDSATSLRDALNSIPRNIRSTVTVTREGFTGDRISGQIGGATVSGSRQFGGPVMAGQAYMIHGPEYFVPSATGAMMTPQQMMQSITNNNQRTSSQEFNLTVQTTGDGARDVIQAFDTMRALAGA